MDAKGTLTHPTDPLHTNRPLGHTQSTPPVSVVEKSVRKMKKDRLKDKKKGKLLAKADTSSSNHENELVILNFEKPFHQITLMQSPSNASKQSTTHSADERASYSFEKLLRKPTYLSVSAGNRIMGHFGHATAYLKRPVLEGQFYIEFIFLNPTVKNHKLAHQPALRVGVCSHAFNSSFPLGWEDSVGYKSSDGCILNNGETVFKGEGFEPGDVMGISLKMSPPYKHADSSKLSEGSSVTFYKNGQQIYSFQALKQIFYCFGVSTYNYSEVQAVLEDMKFGEGLGKGYPDCLTEKIQYKDLQDSGIFKI